MHPELSHALSELRALGRAALGGGASLHAVGAALERLNPAQLGVDSRLRGMPRGVPYTSAPILEGAELGLSLFLVPKDNVLPLHDHPEMHVLTRVLAGRLEVTCYDRGPRLGDVLLGRPHHGTWAPHEGALIAGPRVRNVHRLRALEDTAFLDLFLPPYAPPLRRCTYYDEGEPVLREGERWVRLHPR
jgi:PCO_ADO